jgi:hypothetical protein
VDRGASPFRDGKFLSAEIIQRHVTSELAYVVEIERVEAKVGGREETTPWALRATIDLSSRGWHLEGSASSRRPHNHGASS